MPLLKAPADPETAAKWRRNGMRARQRMQERMGREGYRLSQKCRKKIEEGYGWLKSIGGLGRSRVVGQWKLKQLLEYGAVAFNLVLLMKLKPA